MMKKVPSKSNTDQARNGCTSNLTDKQIAITKRVKPPSDEMHNSTTIFLNGCFVSLVLCNIHIQKVTYTSPT